MSKAAHSATVDTAGQPSRRAKPKAPSRKVELPECYADVLFGFVSDLVADGYERAVDEGDAYVVKEHDHSLAAHEAAVTLQGLWREEVAKAAAADEEPSLIAALLQLLSRDLCRSAFFNTSQCLMELSRPVLLFFIVRTVALRYLYLPILTHNHTLRWNNRTSGR